jgi:hypothetical protein
MSHHPSSPVDYRIDPSLDSPLEYHDSTGTGLILEGPGPSRPYRYTSAMPLRSPASMPQTPLASGPVSKSSFQIHDVSHPKKAFLGGFASPYDAYTHHLSQEVSRLARENSNLKIQLDTTT